MNLNYFNKAQVWVFQNTYETLSSTLQIAYVMITDH